MCEKDCLPDEELNKYCNYCHDEILENEEFHADCFGNLYHDSCFKQRKSQNNEELNFS